MAFREYHTRPRLQVPFERYRTALVGELDDDINNPGPSECGVRAAASVVRVQSRRKIRGQPGVVAARSVLTLENVNDALGRHVAVLCKATAGPNIEKRSQSLN